MARFALLEIKGLKNATSSKIFKLTEDGKCRFDDFWEKMERAGNQKKELLKIQTFLALLEEGIDIPGGKFKELPRNNSTNKNKLRDDHKDYEMKEGQLRLYMFKDEECGLIIVLGEFKKDKGNQSDTIAKMREIKMEYFIEKEELRKLNEGKIKIEITDKIENDLESADNENDLEN